MGTSVAIVALFLLLVPHLTVFFLAVAFVFVDPRHAWKHRKVILRDIVKSTWFAPIWRE